MKIKQIFLVFAFLLCGLSTYGRDKKVTITASEADAIIYADGQQVGVGNAVVVVPAYGQVTVKVVKLAYITFETTYYNGGGKKPPKSYHVKMIRDDAYDASTRSDKANVDFTIIIKDNISAEDAWKLTTQIVTDYFDAIEVSDIGTTYLRTSWNVQGFVSRTVRTRFIIKLGTANPLTYKIKLVSEASNYSGVSVKSDESFKEWDRILRKYENIISDFNTRLGKN